MIEIPLSKRGWKHTGKYIAIVDDIDGDLAKLNWSICSTKDGVYAKRQHDAITKKIDLLHRIILERIIGRPLAKGEYPDHINRNKLDNRRENLRVATNSQNTANASRSKSNTSGYKGVTWDKNRGKWIAQIKVDGKHKHLGRYETSKEAYTAYCNAAVEYFGEFACLA